MAAKVEVKWEDLKILATEEIEVWKSPTSKVHVMQVTYTWRDFPPRTIWIDKEKYTRENVLKLIAEDLSKLMRAPALPP
jgi:hypothetical protein